MSSGGAVLTVTADGRAVGFCGPGGIRRPSSGSHTNGVQLCTSRSAGSSGRIAPAPHQDPAVRQHMGVNGDVGKRENRFPPAPYGRIGERERERRRPGRRLVGGGGRPVAAGDAGTWCRGRSRGFAGNTRWFRRRRIRASCPPGSSQRSTCCCPTWRRNCSGNSLHAAWAARLKNRLLPTPSWLPAFPSPRNWLPVTMVTSIPGTSAPAGSRMPERPRGSGSAGICQALPRFAMGVFWLRCPRRCARSGRDR